MSIKENKKSKDIIVILASFLLVFICLFLAPLETFEQELKPNSLPQEFVSNSSQKRARESALFLCNSIEKKDINGLLAIWYNDGKSNKEKLEFRIKLSKKYTGYFIGKTEKNSRAYNKLMEQVRGIRNDLRIAPFVLSGDTLSLGTLAYKYRNFKKTKKATLSIILDGNKFKITDID